jgi:dipeptidyl aminopeptidase/acylaminoacyl peptidase
MEGEDSRVQAVVACFAPVDLSDDGDPTSAVRQLMGGAQDENPRLWSNASASTHISPNDPPVLLIHGDRDETVPLFVSERYFDQLKNAGVETQFVVVQGAGHAFRGRNINPSLEQIDGIVLKFLEENLGR